MRGTVVQLLLSLHQVKYKQAAKEQTALALYSRLPETLETKHAKEVTELQSEVSGHSGLSRSANLSLEFASCPFESGLFSGGRGHKAMYQQIHLNLCLGQQKYTEEGRKEMTFPLYAQLPETAETQFAREMTEILSEVRFVTPQDMTSFNLLMYLHL